MKSEILGVKILPSNSSNHQPGTIEVSTPHRLEGFDGPTMRLYTTIVGYGSDGHPAVIHQVPELPTRLGSLASNLVTEVVIRTTVVKV